MKEVDLSEPVRMWLESQGYLAYAEVPFLYGIPDWLGVHSENDKTIAVEMKRSLTRGVIGQAYTLNLACDYVFVAVGTKPRKSSIERCERVGLGILSVVGGVVTVVLEAVTKHNGPLSSWKERLIKRVENLEPGGIAGNPTQLGEGPAQDCYDRVQEYRLLHPKATWKELYKNVANHYASHRSMSGALRTVMFDRKSKEDRCS